MDSLAYYDPPSPSSSSADSIDSDLLIDETLPTNSGNKLNPSARFTRRGKICAWGPAYEDAQADRHIRKRFKLCLEQYLPTSATDLGIDVPQNIARAEARRKRRLERKEDEKEWVLPHLTESSPPLSTAKLAPTLAIPQTYVDIMLSPAMRHTLGDDSVDTGLQRTTAELLEGEKGLMQACGRLREVLRIRGRDILTKKDIEPKMANGDHQPNGHATADKPAVATTTTGLEPSSTNAEAGSSAAPIPIRDRIPPLPHISDTDNLWRVAQELLIAQPPPAIQYKTTVPGSAITTSEPQPTPTPVQRLFTSETGLTLSATPHASHPGWQYAPGHPAYPHTVRYNLNMSAQCRAVDDALERIGELLADCVEYKERLEEARDRIADVARARKRVWGVVKERAGAEMDRM